MWALVFFVVSGFGEHQLSSVVPMKSRAECEQYRSVLVSHLPAKKADMFQCWDMNALARSLK